MRIRSILLSCVVFAGLGCGAESSGEGVDDRDPVEVESGLVPILECAERQRTTPLAPNEDCASSSLELFVRDENGNLPARVEGTAFIGDKTFEFACRAEDGRIVGESFSPETGGNYCQPCAVTLFSGHQLWDTESVVVQVENPDNDTSATLGPVDVQFTGTCGGARLTLVL